MNFFLGFFFVDPSLGKIDKFSIPQQTLMELLIEGITANRKIICGSTQNPKDVSEWANVKLNASNEIIEFDWTWHGLCGSIDLKWLPDSLVHVKLPWNNLMGTADLTCLPDCLEELYLSHNKLEGTVYLTQLPIRMRVLHIRFNQFSGSTDFCKLPKSLVDLNLAFTQLEGEIFVFDGNLEVEESNVKDMRGN